MALKLTRLILIKKTHRECSKLKPKNLTTSGSEHNFFEWNQNVTLKPNHFNVDRKKLTWSNSGKKNW